MKPNITIVGAGISGLSAALHLHKKGYPIKVIEATDRVGGRIKTDLVNGFRLDRGFQVLLTAYPEAKKMLDYEALQLKTLLPGAMVLYDGGKFEIADPFRRPSAFFATLFAPAGTLKDKFLTFLLKYKLINKPVATIFEQKQTSSYNHVLHYGFSKKMLDRFFVPFFSGIFLEDALLTPNRMFDFVMKMFSEGSAAIPALGMEEIPKQLAQQLPKDCFLFNTKVVAINDTTLTFENGNKCTSDIIILATEANGLVKSIKNSTETAHQSVTNVYFEATNVPTKKAIVVLNASKNKKYVNNITVLTNVSTAYAPDGKILISVSCNGIVALKDLELANKMKEELQPWFGNSVESWKPIKTYKIKYALPNVANLQETLSDNELKIAPFVYCCGDYLMNGSINAALKSGSLVADLIERDFSKSN